MRYPENGFDFLAARSEKGGGGGGGGVENYIVSYEVGWVCAARFSKS